MKLNLLFLFSFFLQFGYSQCTFNAISNTDSVLCNQSLSVYFNSSVVDMNYNIVLLNNNSIQGNILDTTTLSPTSDSTFFFLYTNGIDSCFDTLNTHYLSANIIEDEIIICPNTSVQILTEHINSQDPIFWSPSSFINDISISNPTVNPISDTYYYLNTICNTDSVLVRVDSLNVNIIPSDSILCQAEFLHLDVDIEEKCTYSLYMYDTTGLYHDSINIRLFLSTQIVDTFYLNHYPNAVDSTFYQFEVDHHEHVFLLLNAVNPNNNIQMYMTNGAGDTVLYKDGLTYYGHIVSTFSNCLDSYSWNPNPLLSNDSILDPTIFISDTTELVFNVTNANNCTFSDTSLITIYEDIPSMPLYLNKCVGEDIVLPAYPLADSYSWSPGIDLNDSTIAKPLTSSNLNTSYHVTYFTQGCIQEDSIFVINQQLPSINTPYIRKELCCENDTLEIDFGVYAQNYDEIYINNVLNNGDTAYYYSAGQNSTIYDFVELKTNSGCTTSDTLEIRTVCSNPVITATDIDYLSSDIFTLNFNNNNADATTFIWGSTNATNGAISDNNVQNPQFNGNQIGSFQTNVAVSSYFLQANGTYYTCTEVSDTESYQILVVSIHENEFDENIQVYPNPANNKLNIDFEKLQPILDLNIFNELGQKVESLQFEDIKTINLNIELVSGIYFIEITNQLSQKIRYKLLIK